jgi:hypothetical protein
MNKSILTILVSLSMISATAASAADAPKTAATNAAPAMTATPAGDMKSGDMKSGDMKSGDMKSGDMAMMPMKPGAETKALEPFFGKGGSWSGKVVAGAMAPDSKEMPSKGKATCKTVAGGFFYACDVEETMGAGKQAMTWKGNMVVGWDVAAKAYRSYSAGNFGNILEYNGTLDGKKFSLENPTAFDMMGHQVKERLTWDMSDAKATKFTLERSTDGGEWKVFETADMKSAAGVKNPT